MSAANLGVQLIFDAKSLTDIMFAFSLFVEVNVKKKRSRVNPPTANKHSRNTAVLEN
jgi:hypothetical protein